MRHCIPVSLFFNFFVLCFMCCLVSFSYAGTLAYSTYLGGGGDDYGYSITIDGSGNAYITGETWSSNFPTTAGAFDTSYNGGVPYTDVFVTKLNASGTAVVYSTYLGGGSDDAGSGITVDGSGNAYITGDTLSFDFPTTPGAFDTLFNGGGYYNDVFVAKLNSSGTVVVYSTFLGGGSSDYGNGIAIDGSGNAYITGYTGSDDFPTTPGASDTIYNGNSDVFVTKLNPGGTAVVYSTYLGGGSGDYGYGIAIDSSRNAYITGVTASINFPITAGTWDTSLNGDNDSFVTKLNPSGSAMEYSTYLGGNDEDAGNNIAVDASGNAYLIGYTNSNDFPTTAGAFDTSFHGSDGGYVTKLNPSGTGLVYSTYFGGSGWDYVRGIAVDISGNAYLTGITASSDFPTTIDAWDTGSNGGEDVFVSKLNPSGTALVYSTYLGGSGIEYGYGIAVDAADNVYLTGYTNSGNFPTTAGSLDTSYNGNYDVFVTKLSLSPSLVYSTFLGGNSRDYGNSIAVDNSGNVYITGQTGSYDFPTTAGVFDTSFDWDDDIYVTKLNSSGTGLVYSTFLGGESSDNGFGIAIDSSGNAYISGHTISSDFPTTSGAFDTSYNGDWDTFVTKLNTNGTGLLYSTYLGSAGIDFGFKIDIDNSGNAYIIGYTNSSTNFPTTAGAFDRSYNGGYWDGFVTKLNASGTGLVYSNYLGGSDEEYLQDISVNGSGNAYIIGYTSSTNFPTTLGAFDTLFNGYNDVFITKLNPTGTVLVYSTYLGGSNLDECQGLAVDGLGNAYITGRTYSTNFPTTPGAFDISHNGYCDVYVSKLNPSGTALVYSTFLGGGNTDLGSAIAVDTSGNAYLTGYTYSSNFPTTPGAIDPSFNGYTNDTADVFVSKLNPTGTALLYSTYLGGGNNDYGSSVAVDSSGKAYITGSTSSPEFPTTPGAFDISHNGYDDAFVSKMSLVDSIRYYLNSYGAFTGSHDITHWYWEKYGDGISAGTLSWSSVTECIAVTQNPGQKGKLTQIFSVPSTGWYTATANVLTNIATVSKRQKVYLYLQQLDSSTTIVATGNQVIQPGAGGLDDDSWRTLEISFYATGTILAVQVVAINNASSGVSGALYLDDIWVYAGGPVGTNPIVINNGSFDAGTSGWLAQIYADGTGMGSWGRMTSLWGHTGLVQGVQAGGQKAKLSQLYSADIEQTLATVWVFSSATSKNNTQKVYLYVYSYDSGYSKVIESGNGILQAGKWAPNQWRQIQFGYTPLNAYNAVQVVGINPTGKPNQNLYFDMVELKQ
jgi:hypothetical protein